jgi:aspartate aminotransferase
MPAVWQAGIEALQGGQTKYTAPRGTLDIRTKVAEYTNRTRALDDQVGVTANQVVIGPGCKPGIFMAILAVVGSGDEVVIPDPGFPAYINAIDVSAQRRTSVLQHAEQPWCRSQKESQCACR